MNNIPDAMSNPEFAPREFGNPLEHWKRDFKDVPASSNIGQIYYLPDKSDMAGNIIRSNFDDLASGDCVVMLIALCMEHEDEDHLEFFRMILASRAARGGAARVEALMGGTGVVDNVMYRLARNMGVPKDMPTQQQRRSDFRSDGKTIEHPAD